MTDAETTAAIEALAHRVRLRDDAIRNDEDHADPEVFAAEYLTAMRGHGWRVTEAKALPSWKLAGAAGVPLRPETLDLRRELHADLEAKAAAAREAKDAAREDPESAA